MTWFKLDDSFYDHPKVFDAPDCAVALWTRAGCWSARNLTDGFVPAGMPARLCGDPDTAVRELVRRGLWSRASGGYQFHDWSEYQPSAAEVRSTRDKRAAAGRLGGLVSGRARSKRASKREANASAIVQPPSRPVPPPPGERDGGTVTRLLPPWCGRCNKDTRLDINDDDRSVPCHRCHPDRRRSA